MKIILYPSANPDKHGPIGKVIEVTAEHGCRCVSSGIAMVVEYDKTPQMRSVSKMAAEHLKSEEALREPEPEVELDDKDDDDGEDEYQEETDEEV